MENSEIIKLSKSHKQLLSKIDEDSKWIDLKQIKKINEELQDLGIYSSKIGKKCSKYLNEASITGKLDINGLFDNCYEARLAKNKKIKAENKIKDKKARAGLVKGNIGSKNPPQSQPTQNTQTNKSESAVIKKAKEIGQYITDLLTKSKRSDGWKENITKYITKIGMESLLSIVYGVMGTTDNQVGQFVIGSTALGLIGSIYAYVYEIKTGQKITVEIKKWITGKLIELYDYLNNLGITVFKKPKGGGSGGGGGMSEPRQAKQPRQSVSSMLSAILGEQSAQQTQNLINANNEKLFEQNTINPLSNKQTTESILRQQKAQSESLNSDTAQKESNFFNNIMSAGVAGTLGGAGWYANHISNLPQSNIDNLGDMVSDALPRDTNMPQPVDDSIDLEDIGQPRNKMNRERDTEIKRVKDELDKINKQKKEEKDIEDKVKKQIDDLDLHGQAWGLGNPAFHNAGKMAQSAMSSLLFSGNNMEQYNQEFLLQDIANQAQENIAKVEEDNRQSIAIGLINAREGTTEERKLLEAEQEFLNEQEQIRNDIDNKVAEAQEDIMGASTMRPYRASIDPLFTDARNTNIMSGLSPENIITGDRSRKAKEKAKEKIEDTLAEEMFGEISDSAIQINTAEQQSLIPQTPPQELSFKDSLIQKASMFL